MISRSRAVAVSIVVAAPLATFLACVEPPPKIASIPSGGLALRVHVFGADAKEARGYFDAAKQNNRGFTVVQEGGDGDVVVGLENDSPKCVAPTALCSYKVSYRVRDRKGETLQTTTTTVSATSDKCADLCSKALVQITTKVIDAAASLLVSAGSVSHEGGLEGEGGAASTTIADDAAAPTASAEPESSPKPGAKKKPGAKADPKGTDASRAEPVMCVVGHGGRLPTDEAERRTAQVEALKRINVLEQAEYDCLRKAYLNRL
ncbi:MAG: hypothetical protein JST00_01985 [Deltaproteobacteria bacterium]|nr:hypothetical protein [Deltaproteobacteria bacterium]